MAAIDCANCFGYEGCRLCLQLDPVGDLDVTDNGELAVSSSWRPKSVCDEDFSEEVTCGNDVRVDPSGCLWVSRNPCVVKSWGNERFTNDFALDGDWESPTYGIVIPVSDQDYATCWRISLGASITMDSVGGPLSTALQFVGDGEVLERWDYRYPEATRFVHSFIHGWTRTQQPGQALILPLQIRADLIGLNSNPRVLDYSFEWHGLGIKGPGGQSL